MIFLIIFLLTTFFFIGLLMTAIAVGKSLMYRPGKPELLNLIAGYVSLIMFFGLGALAIRVWVIG